MHWKRLAEHSRGGVFILTSAAALSFALPCPVAAQAELPGTITRIGDLSEVFDLAVLNGALYFATGSRPGTLHRFDGETLIELGQIGRTDGHNGRNAIIEYATVGEDVYLATDSIYRTDGSTLEELLAPDGGQFSGGKLEHAGFFPFHGEVYFAARTERSAAQVFRTDGNRVVKLTDLNVGSEPFNVGAFGGGTQHPHFTEFRDQLFFTADVPGRRLLRTDGDAVVQIGAFAPRGSEYFDISPFTQFLGSLYFGATDYAPDGGDDVSGTYRYDGSQPELVSGVFPSGPFVEFRDYLYFVGDVDGDHELFRTNGSDVVQMADINPDGDSVNTFTQLIPFSDALYFVAHGPDGNELYRTDGQSVTQVADINPDGDAFVHSEFYGARRSHFAYEHRYDSEAVAVLRDFLYFTATGPFGTELYRTDGRDVTLVADINPHGNSLPTSFTVLGDELYFSARGAHGRELYKTDGSEVVRLTDINPGVVEPDLLSRDNLHVGDSLIEHTPLTVLDGEIYFSESRTGRLYRYTPVPEPSTLLLATVGIIILLLAPKRRAWSWLRMCGNAP